MNEQERSLLEELIGTCQAVVDNWEQGDLAQAARECDRMARAGRQYLKDHPEKGRRR